MRLYPISPLTILQDRTVTLSDFQFDDGYRFNGAVTIDVLHSGDRGHVYLDRGNESRRLTATEARRLTAACCLTDSRLVPVPV